MERKLKVLHIISGDLWAGAENMVFNLCLGQKHHPSVSVYALVLNFGELERNLKAKGIETFVLDESENNIFALLKKSLVVIKNILPDVIHTHRKKENILGSMLSVKTGIPSVRTLHGANEHRVAYYKVWKHMSNFLDWLFGRYIQKKIVAVSPVLKEELIKVYGKARVEYIRNGIDLGLIAEKSRETADIVLPDGKFLVGIVGRIVPVKRLDLFINIAETLLKQNNENYHFVVIGDGPERKEYELDTRRRKIDKNFTFTGHVSNTLPVLDKLDILLMLSDHEGMPMVLLESLALKTPILAHNVGAISTLLEGGKHGTLINCQVVSEYVSVIEDVAQNAEKYISKAESGKRHIENKYSSNTMANGYLSLYRVLK